MRVRSLRHPCVPALGCNWDISYVALRYVLGTPDLYKAYTPAASSKSVISKRLSFALLEFRLLKSSRTLEISMFNIKVS